MIIINLIGGLGNQMFQYAAGRSLAIHHNTELKLDISVLTKNKKKITDRYYGLSNYNICENFASKAEINNSKKPHKPFYNLYLDISGIITGRIPRQYKKELYFNFDPDFFCSPDNIYLIGFWQSEKYFKNIEEVIRREFTLREKPDNSNLLMSQKILGTNAISIHVRRGDYVSNPRTNTHHGICQLEYYSRAIKFIEEKCSDPHFYIFSDDLQWVQKNLDLKYNHTYMVRNKTQNDFLDMWLMSLCKHHIIANSSFSWWGAWLCKYDKKRIVAPKKWVNDPTVNICDILPKDWYTL